MSHFKTKGVSINKPITMDGVKKYKFCIVFVSSMADMNINLMNMGII